MRKFTYDKLFSVCSKYGMKQHQLRCEEKYEYFTKLGFSNEEAKSNVLAIAFYTGSKSETIKSVLWVDDHIFEEKWENKRHGKSGFSCFE
jgi:hypothetical protein